MRKEERGEKGMKGREKREGENRKGREGSICSPSTPQNTLPHLAQPFWRVAQSGTAPALPSWLAHYVPLGPGTFHANTAMEEGSSSPSSGVKRPLYSGVLFLPPLGCPECISWH